MPIRSRIVKIGNSRGIRIPKPMLEQAGLESEVEIEIADGRLVLSTAREPRAGWDAAFKKMARVGEDELLDGDAPLATDWDEREWRWP